MGKGIDGLIMKAWSAEDYTFTVTSTEAVTDKYIRIGFSSEGFFEEHPAHPTQWVRLWIDDGTGRHRQRGYTLVDADPDKGTFFVEFALHYGPASIWAAQASVGDVIEASVIGKGANFTMPDPAPSHVLAFGDTASLPAINALLTAIGDIPARIWLESQFDSDPTLPVHAGPNHQVTWVQRVDDGRLLREAADHLRVEPGTFAWVTCDGRTTRHIVKALKTAHHLHKDAVKAQAYWK